MTNCAELDMLPRSVSLCDSDLGVHCSSIALSVWGGWLGTKYINARATGNYMTTVLSTPLGITKTRLFKYTENSITKKKKKNEKKKKWKISDKKILIFFIFLHKNIDRGYSLEPPRQGGSNEYPQCMFLSRNKKNNVLPCKPQFYYIKVGFTEVKII